MAATSSLTNLLYRLIVALALGHGAGAATAHPTAPAPRAALHRSRAPRLAGEWEATGRVIGAYGIANRATGEVLRRRWRFGTVCLRERCRTDFSRTAAGAEVATAVLRLQGDHFSASFPHISDGCEERPGWFAAFAGRFRIWRAKRRDRLYAVENGFFAGGHGCGPAAEQILWTARLRDGFPRSPGI